MSALPEPGPARDRAVAELVFSLKCERYDPPDYSTDPAKALLALEGWRAKDKDRAYFIRSPRPARHAFEPSRPDWLVELEWPAVVDGDEYGTDAVEGSGPTLPAAATAALLATRGVG